MAKSKALRPASASLALLLLCGATSCVTYLSSGQLGHDSLVPPPPNPRTDSAGETQLFGRVSYARGLFYTDDNNLFGHAGLLRTRRQDRGDFLLDSYAAAGAWYGIARLHEHGSVDTAYQYPVQLAESYQFYGASVQAGSAIGWKIWSSLVFDLGLRGSLAYEDGPYRAFRASAANKGSGSWVVDRSPSGWSANAGLDLAPSWSVGHELSLRLGYYMGWVYPDLAGAFSDSGGGLDFIEQASLALRNERYSLALSWDMILLNQGISVALGYFLP